MTDIDFTKFPEWHSQVIMESAASGRSESSIINDEFKRLNSEINRLREENGRLNRYVKQSGKTLIMCPNCGRGMLAKDTQCVLCELTEVRSELEHYKRLIEAKRWFEADGVPVED